MLQSSPCSKDEQHLRLTPTRTPTGMERLPAELLDAICKYLPVRSAIALHRTSKTLAISIPLDSTFWRDSLREGNLHPHIPDFDTRWVEQHLAISNAASTTPTLSWDWRGVAQLLATKKFPITGQDSRLDAIPNEYWNRCRIWNIVEEALIRDHDSLFDQRRSDSCVELHKP
jgi:hypothetical protein